VSSSQGFGSISSFSFFFVGIIIIIYCWYCCYRLRLALTRKEFILESNIS